MNCNFYALSVNIADRNIGVIICVVELDIPGKDCIIFIHDADSGTCMYVNTRQLLCKYFSIRIDRTILCKLSPAFFFCAPAAKGIRDILWILRPVSYRLPIINKSNIIKPIYAIITC